jgi:hypothetical protein
MAGSDDIVRVTLARLLDEHPRATVLDPAELPGLLQPALTGAATAGDDLVRAAVHAVRTPALRALVERVPGASREALVRDLRTIGVAFPVAERVAAVWTGALAAAAAPPAAAATPAAAAAPAAAAPGTATPPPPAAGAPRPATPPEPVTATSARSLTPPAPPAPATVEPRTTAPVDLTAANRRAATPEPSPPGRAVVVLAVVALVAVAAAVAGWARDPSKERAATSETGESAEATLQAARDDLRSAQTRLTQRTGELDAAREQLAKVGTVALTQVTGARLPHSFALTGKVAPGSCSLTGEACNVTTTVRNLTLSCTGTSCDCITGSCTVTSDLWKTPASLAFDAATTLYTARGNLDADVFRCGGVPQPTTYELRLRVTRATWSDGAWVASGLEAELAQASAPAAACLAGNRTYALGGPAA